MVMIMQDITVRIVICYSLYLCFWTVCCSLSCLSCAGVSGLLLLCWAETVWTNQRFRPIYCNTI